MNEGERAARREALERMATFLATTKRHRSPIEAPLRLTKAYIELVIAGGFARLGDVDRVARGLANARGVLAPTRDTVHGFALDAFAARAFDDRDALAALDERYRQLDRVSRYKVEYLFESSMLLAPARDGIDPIGNFSLRTSTTPSLLAPATTLQSENELIARVAGTDDHAAIAKVVVELEQCPAKDRPWARRQLLRDFAVALATAPDGRAIAWSERVATTFWPTITDSWGPNSHYCASVVAAADALVRMIAGA